MTDEKSEKAVRLIQEARDWLTDVKMTEPIRTLDRAIREIDEESFRRSRRRR